MSHIINNFDFAKITEILLDKYMLEANGEKVKAVARGNVKKRGNILVGDNAKIEKIADEYVIKEILPRKNFAIRPPVANIDQMVIVMSIVDPIPDYMLLDMQLVYCLSNNIEPIICINKMDLNKSKESKISVEYIKNIYEKIGVKVIYISVNENSGIDELINVLNGKTSALSGNSGVGKSSITKNLIGDNEILIGDVSKKISRGKNTTKYVKLYKLNNNTYIFDTPGFSSYELYNFDYRDLRKYYNDFNDYKCEYDDCLHYTENESVCSVKRALKDGKIDKGRYERYVYLLEKLKDVYDRRYK